MEKHKIKSYIKQIRGVSYKPDDLCDVLDDSSVILLRANNIEDGIINFDGIQYVSKSRVSSEQYLKKGDILICASSGSKNLVGKAASFDFDIECTFGAFCKVIRPKDGYSQYLSIFFQSQSYRKNISRFAIGANINNIRNEHIDELYISMYPESERLFIVKKINTVQSIIFWRKNMIKKLDELIKARFVEMFGYPSINNKRWQMGVINEIGSCIAGATPSTKVDEYWNNGTIPWMSSGEVNKGRVDRTDNFITHLGYDKTSTKLVPPKTVVLAMAGQGKTRGMAAITEIELCTNQSICSIVNNEKVDAEYLLYFLKLQYNELRRASTNTDGRGGLNLKIIGNYPIMIPPVALQKYFATFVTQVNKSKLITYYHLKSIYTKPQLCCKMVVVNDFLNTKRF